jgi:hypothetical protein
MKVILIGCTESFKYPKPYYNNMANNDYLEKSQVRSERHPYLDYILKILEAEGKGTSETSLRKPPPQISEPLIEEGDLRNVYSSKTRRLPEILDEKAFTVRSNQKAQILEDDMELRDGVRDILLEIDDLPGSYLIVDIGHAHLPGVAEMLEDFGIECYFVIPGKISDRFQETSKYWAKDFKAKKDRLNPQGYATLVDIHREYSLKKEYFPTPEKLKQLRIKEIIYLTEAPVGKFPDAPIVKDLENIFQSYQTAGFKIKAYGIDKRQGFRNSV